MRLPAKNRHNGLTMAMFLVLRWFELFVALWFGSVVLTHFEEVGALAVMVGTLAIGVALEAMTIAVERTRADPPQARPDLLLHL